MPDHREDFAGLMQRVREGSDEAVFELLEICEEDIYHTVRRKLNRQLRAKFDSEDFVQAVWATFFAHLSVISKFKSRDSLIGYLVRVAGNKVMEEFRRRLMTQKYNLNRECSLDEGNNIVAESVRSREPSPSDTVILKEQWNRSFGHLSPRDRRIVQFHANQMKGEEIAQELGVHKKTVYRVLRKFCEQLAQ